MRHLQERRAVNSPLSGRRGGRRRRLAIPFIAAAVVAADQITKTWALHHLSDGPRHVVGTIWLVLTYNSGAAFSLGTGITPIVEAIVVFLVVWLLAVSRRASRGASVPAVIGLGLVLGGALSNLGDRLLRHLPGHPGAVVDFIQAVSWWPVFNIADSAIVLGVLVLLVAYSTQRRPAGAR